MKKTDKLAMRRLEKECAVWMNEVGCPDKPIDPIAWEPPYSFPKIDEYRDSNKSSIVTVKHLRRSIVYSNTLVYNGPAFLCGVVI